MRAPVRTTVNGVSRDLEVDAERPLLGVLRDVLSLTGAKYGCGEAQCGACTVIVDGHAVRSCVVPVSQVAGKKVTTIEGLAGKDGALHPVQDAFIEAGAMQCGYCTPGMVLSAVALLGSRPNPTDEEIVSAMDGNVCRCGVYSRVVSAIRKAAVAVRVGGGGK